MYRFLIINYGIIWALLLQNYWFGLFYFILVFYILIVIKLLKLLFTKVWLKVIIYIIGLIIPGLNIILLAILLLTLKLMLIESIIKNWFLLMLGLVLYCILFFYCVDVSQWIIQKFPRLNTTFLSFTIAVVIIYFSAKTLGYFGFQRKNIEFSFLSFPIFIVPVFYSFLNPDSDLEEN